jgi:hypothetical protein
MKPAFELKFYDQMTRFLRFFRGLSQSVQKNVENTMKYITAASMFPFHDENDGFKRSHKELQTADRYTL